MCIRDRLFTIAPKFEGYVDRLLVNVPGQPVTKGQALLELSLIHI